MEGRTKISIRRILAFALSVMLIVNMVPGNVFMARAAGEKLEFQLSGEAFVTEDDTVTVTLKDTDNKPYTVTNTNGVYEADITDAAFPLSCTATSTRYEGEVTVSITETQAANPVVLDFSTNTVKQVTVSGKILDQNDHPLEDAVVAAYYDLVDEANKIADVTVNADGSYSFTSNVKRDVVLSVKGKNVDTTKKIEVNEADITDNNITATRSAYTITREITRNGNTNVDSIAVNNGEDKIVDINPVPGYKIATLTVDGKEVSEAIGKAEYSHGFKAVKENHSIQATFVAAGELSIIELPSEWVGKDYKVTGTYDIAGLDVINGIEIKYQIDKGPWVALEAENVVPNADDATKGDFSIPAANRNNVSLTVSATYKVDGNKDDILQITKKADGTLKQDMDVPTITFSEVTGEDKTYVNDGTLWAAEGAKFTVTATDANSEAVSGINVDSFVITKPEGTNDEITENANPATVTIKPAKNYEGSIKYEADVNDNAGNSAISVEKTINVDNKAPEIVISPNENMGGNWYHNETNKQWFTAGNAEFSLPVSMKDGGSGIAGYYYQVDGNIDVKNITQWTPFSEENVNLLADGKALWEGAHTLYVVARDNLDNISEVSTFEYTVDRTAPEVSFKFNIKSDIWHILTFGLFGNQTLTVEITATDVSGIDWDQNPLSLKLINGTNGETDITCEKDAVNNKLTFTIPNLDPEKKDQVLDGTLALELKDRVQNQNEKPYIPTTVTIEDDGESLEIADGYLMIETKAPEATLSKTESGVLVGEKEWFDADTEVHYTVNASDADSGLFDVDVVAKGAEGQVKKFALSTELGSTATATKKVPDLEEEISIPSKDADPATGRCDIQVSVTDNAGNVLEPKVETTIWFDKDAPQINSFAFGTVDGKTEAKEIDVVADGNYGFIFNQETTVTANITDYILKANGEKTTNLGSGIKSVKFSTIPAKDCKVDVDVDTVTVEGDNYTITIPEGFKGQIIATVEDNAGHSTAKSPDLTVIENQEQHEVDTTATITLPPAEYKDAQGRDLYEYNPTAEILVQNAFVGIKSATYTRKDTSGTSTLTYEVDLNKNESNNGFDVEKDKDWDNNLRTKITKKDDIKYQEESGIELNLNMTCQAGHETKADTKTISVDTLAPRLNITWKDVGQYVDEGNNKYYTKRIATIKVEERNFDESQCEFDITGGTAEISSWQRSAEVEYGYEATVTFSVDGNYTFNFSSTDLAGHKSEQKFSFTIDTIPPEITIQPNENMGEGNKWFCDEENNKWYTDGKVEFNLPVTVTDGVSKIKDYYYQIDKELNLANITEWRTFEPETGEITLLANGDALEEGEHIIYVVARDNVNNVSEITSFPYIVDQTAPGVKINPNENMGEGNKWFCDEENNKWYTDGEVEFNLPVTVTDGVSKIKDYYYQIDKELNLANITEWRTFEPETGEITLLANGDALEEGEHIIYVVARDNVNNVSEITSFPYIVDQTAPGVKINPNENMGEGNKWFCDEENNKWYTDGEVEFNLPVTVTDGVSKLKDYYYQIDGELNLANITEWRTFEPETGEITLLANGDALEEGEHIIYVVARDNVNNVSEITSFPYIVDQTAPGVKINPNENMGEGNKWFCDEENNKWYTDGEVEFNLPVTVTDGVSKLKDYYYQIDGELNLANITEWRTFEPETGEITLLANGDALEEGEHIIYVVARDNVNNVSEITSFPYIVDQTAPEVSFKFEIKSDIWHILSFGLFGHQTLTVEITATDVSGIDWDQNPLSLKLINGTNGETDITCEKDAVNNKLTFTIPNLDPEKKDQVLDGTLALELKDRVQNQNEKPYIPTTVTIEDDGESLEIADGYLMIETKAPEATLSKTESGVLVGEKEWFDADTEVHYTVNASDADSGLFDVDVVAKGAEGQVKKFALSTELGSTATATKKVPDLEEEISIPSKDADPATGRCDIQVSVTDNAGNVLEPKVETTIWFDKDAPQINSFAFGTVDGKTEAKEIDVVADGNYGFIFNQETTVTANITDYILKANGEKTTNLGSGIKSVKFSTIPAKDCKVDVDVDTVTVEGDNYTITIPEGFKGQIIATVEDNAGHSTAKSPDLTVIENQEQHEVDTTATITLPPAEYKDAQGRDLYEYNPTAEILVQNAFVGIKSATYTRKDTSGTSTLTYEVDLNKNESNNGFDVEKDKDWDNNLRTKITKKDDIKYQEESGIELNLNMTCQAGHETKADTKTISVDTLAPRLAKVEWSNVDVRNEKYYKADRTATIKVEERNFDESKCEFITTGPKPAISGWTHVGDVHTAKVTFSEDGDYTFTFRTTDRAGHTSAYNEVFEFVIDKTVPVINVSYDNNNAQNGYYYKEARTATLTINEHNFRAAEVSTTMTANDNGAGIVAPAVNGWSTNGDVNTATVNYSYDGEFTFAMTYEDLAGNQAVAYAEDHFVVDLKDPVLEIYDIVDKSANNDIVAPGVRYSDTNYDEKGVQVALVGANNGDYSMEGKKVVDSNGVDLKLNDFPREKGVDDLYTMTATVTDLSGRTSEQTVMFSVNRFGSVYVLDAATKALVEDNEGYTNEEQIVGIREINVDILNAKEVSYSRDGELERLTEGEDYKVQASGSQETWKEYYYQIAKENFAEEGNYNVTIFSEDAATNTQDNKSNKRNEECNVEFVIDKTNPSTVVTGIEDKGQYRTTAQKVTIDAKDNTRLAKVIAEIDDRTIEFSEADISSNNGKLSFDIGNDNAWQKIKVYAIDKAGNTDEKEMKSMRVLVTSNMFVQFVNNTPVLIGTIAIVALAAVGAWWFLIVAKKRKKDEEN